LCAQHGDAQSPVPEFYGFYAYYDGKLHDTYKEAGANNYPSTVEFVIFAQGPQKIDFFFLPPEKAVSGTNPQFAGWDDWFTRIKANDKSFQMAMDHGVPPNAVEVQFRTGPYAGRTDLVRVVPSAPLPPGFYQLAIGVRFWVGKGEVEQFYNSAPAASSAPKPSSSRESATRPTPSSSRENAISTETLFFRQAGSHNVQALSAERASVHPHLGGQAFDVPGERSPLQFSKGTKFQILVNGSSSAWWWKNPKEFKLYPLNNKNHKRVSDPKSRIACSIQPADSKYSRIEPAIELPPGEYALSAEYNHDHYPQPHVVFTFGISANNQ